MGAKAGLADGQATAPRCPQTEAFGSHFFHWPPTPLHRYDPSAATRLFALNAISISVLIGLFGWFQTEIYQRMERR